MPLPPLVPSNTCRFYVDYRSQGRDHTIMFRYGGIEGAGPPPSPVLVAVSDFMNAMEGQMPTDYASLGARYSEVGSNVTLPLSPLTFGPGTLPVDLGKVPAFLSFVGRSAGGRRTRVTVLGLGTSPVGGNANFTDYRWSPADSAIIGTLVGILNAGPFNGVDGQAVNWYPYANAGFNGHWQRAVRA